MRLDHLLSKEKSREKECVLLFSYQAEDFSGADAVGGNTRSHPEHDG